MNWIGKVLNRVTGWDRRPRVAVAMGRSAAGVFVTPSVALQNATVWACVQYLTRAVAQLPWHVMVQDAAGNATISKGSVDKLLNSRPNPEMGAFTWRQTMLAYALIWGNAYAEIQWDASNRAMALWPLHPDRVVPRRRENGELYYEVWNSTGNVEIAAKDMFHIRGLGDGITGYSVSEFAAESIGWARATELFSSTFFSEGMNPSGVVKSKAGLSPEGLEELRREIERLYSGTRGKRTAVIDADIDFIPVTADPEKSQFVETRYLQVEEICRWFGVPPHKVMHLLRATFSNIEHQSIEVVVDSVTPWVRIFEQEADYKLFGQNRQGYYTKMFLQALMRGDNASRIAFYKGMAELGMTPNQILALEDLNGIGTDGDVPFVSNNVKPLKQAIAPPLPATPVPPAQTEGSDAQQ